MQIGWFSTGRDEEARRLLEEVLLERQKGLNIDIAFVFCNRQKGESPITDRFLEYVEGQGLRLLTLSSRTFMPSLKVKDREVWREEYHKAVLNIIRPYRVEFSFLAGYMLIVGRSLIENYRMLNLHPALPGGPKGSWQEVIWELIRIGAPYAGAQIHLVTTELDEGPAVTFCKFSIKTPEFQPLWKRLDSDLKEISFEELRRRFPEDYPLFKKIREEEFKREIPLILLTLKRLSQKAVEIKEGGIDLTDEVNRSTKAGPL